MNTSTGFNKALLRGIKICDILNLGKGRIEFYRGRIPKNANCKVIKENILCVLRDNSKPVKFSEDVGRVFIEKRIYGSIRKTGILTYFRYMFKGDKGDYSNTAVRIQGSIGCPNGFHLHDLTVFSTVLFKGNVQTLDTFSISLLGIKS